MADTAIEITAGSGTNVDTRTEGTNGNHRQVVVVGDPATNAGVAPVDATAGLKVDLGADNDVTVTGSVAVTNAGLTELAAAIDTELQVDVVGALPAGNNNIGDVDVATIPGIVGTVADDATTPGAPVMIGGVAVETDGTDPTSVSAEDDVARLRTDRNRILLVNPTPPRHWSVSADYGAAQTNTSVKASPGAGLKLYITDISISNGATAGNITLLDGSGGTVLYEIYAAINGGAVDNRRSPIVLTAATALCITSTTVTTHSINISGYIAP